MKKIVMIVGMIAAALGAWADTWTDPETGIEWTYTVSGGEASVGGGVDQLGYKLYGLTDDEFKVVKGAVKK